MPKRRTELPSGADSIIRFAVTAAVALGLSACASPRTGPAEIGHRVGVPPDLSLSNAGAPSDDVVVGELSRRRADTVWIRPAPASAELPFLVPADEELRRLFPSSALDPWLVDDSLREGRFHEGIRGWRVVGSRADTVFMAGPVTHPTERQAYSLGPLHLQREVRRSRPRKPLIVGSILVGAGLVLGTAGDRDRPAIGTLMAGLVFGGAAAVVSAFFPRVGWDDVEADGLPPISTDPAGLSGGSGR